jgi:hypothetical protein
VLKFLQVYGGVSGVVKRGKGDGITFGAWSL